MLTNVILWVRDWSKSIGGVVGPEQRGWLIGFECLVRVDRSFMGGPLNAVPNGRDGSRVF